ncbi:MAG: hypothetical protein QXR44_04055 [Thermoproteota archaeon]
MVRGWLSLLAFAGGLYLGREVKAKEVEVPPNIVFVPPRIELQPEREPFKPEDIVRQVAKEAWGLELNEEEVKRLAGEFDKRIREVDPKLDRLIKIYRRQSYLDKLEKIATAFCEGRIDRATYLFLTRRYIDKIVSMEFG